MSKFSAIARGKKARLAVELPMLDGQTVAAALVPLFGDDDAAVLAAARLFAKTHGVEKPEPGDPLYERGLWLHTVLRTTMDIDVPDKAEPFFASADEILKYLDPDRISMIFHMQRAWQAVCAPRPGKMGEIDFIRHILELAHAGEEEDRTGQMREVPFDSLPLATQLRFARLLAARFSSWVSLKSLSGSDTPDASSSSRSSSSPETTPTPPAPPSPTSPVVDDAPPSPSVLAAGEVLAADLAADLAAEGAPDAPPSGSPALPASPASSGGTET